MSRPRLRALPPATKGRTTSSGPEEHGPGTSGRPRRAKNGRERLTVTLDVLGLHRRRREVVRAIGDLLEQLTNVLALADSVAADTYSDDPPEELRGASAMMKAASKDMTSTLIDLSIRLGELRLLAFLDAVTLEEGPPEL